MAAEVASAAASMGPAWISAANDIISSGIQYFGNKALAKEQREWNEQMMDKENEWSLNMWNKTNEYNSPTEQVKRLQDAGLNPLYYGLDGSSANGLESAQALGYERAQAPQFGNPVEAFYQTRAAQKDIELKNAQIDKLAQDAEGVRLDNEFKEKTMDARVDSENLKNNLTRAQIKEINANRDKIYAEIKKVVAETDSEIAKKMLYEAETNLRDMEAREIAALLPYKQILMDAQTDAQKAAAAASYARAAIDNGLFEAGYVDNIIDQQCAEYRATLAGAERQEYEAAIAEFKSNLRNGKAIDLSKYEGKPVAKALAKFMNAFYQDTALLGEAIGGVQGLAGVAVGAAVKGNKTVITSAPKGQGFTSKYGE